MTYQRRNLYQLSAICNNKRNKIAYLQCGVQVLEGHVNGLKNQSQQEIPNETYS